jgi:putative transcriptional regulator
MSKPFEEIKEGMLQAIAHAKGRPVPGTRVHYPKPVDVKTLRVGIGMTQEQFAANFGVSTATLRHWERGDRSPHGPALVLLNVIKHNPKAVIKALSA